MILVTFHTGEIEGLRLARGSPMIPHLFFVDDSLLFDKANQKAVIVCERIFREYELASNQVINFQKSYLCLNPNVSEEVVSEMKFVLEVEMVKGHLKYLGLPSSISWNNKYGCIMAEQASLNGRQ